MSTSMNGKCILIFVISFFSFQFSHSQACSQYPVPLEERIAQSSTVVEGKVTRHFSYWNDTHSQILTSYFIEVFKVFKGELIPDTIAIVSQGGQVDMDKLVVHPSLNFHNGDYGIFMLTDLPADYVNVTAQTNSPTINFYRGYAWSQSYISFLQGKVHDAFYTYKNNQISSFYSKLFSYVDSSAYEERKPTPLEYAENTEVNAKAITSFSPAVVTAGTLGALGVLTINGTGFGATQGTGFVRFRNADDGGATFVTVGTDLATDYISWSDVQIVVRVPSGAGTGTFQVRNNGGTTFTSATPVTIDYNGLDVIFDPGTGFQRYEPDLINDNGVAAGDYTLTFNTAFFGNAPAVASFRDGLANWVFRTGVNFVDANAATSAINTNNGGDGVNIVTFNGGLPAGVLGVSFSSYNGCFSGGNVHWFVNDLDMLYSNTPGGLSWYFACPQVGITLSQFDFESVTVHELGHHHQLGHIINTLGVMHFSIANGQVKRLINTNDDAGGDYIMAHSIINNPCGPAAMTMISGPAPGCAPLPVDLIMFDAFVNDHKQVDLSWITASEINNAYFSVQRSTDLIEFEELTRVSGAGNSNISQYYSYTDENPKKGISYYRLHQVDYDGTSSNTTYRKVVLEDEINSEISVYPNPVSELMQVQFPGEGFYELRIYDISGKLVWGQRDLKNGNKIETAQFPNGIYFLRGFDSKGNMSTGKLVISR